MSHRAAALLVLLLGAGPAMADSSGRLELPDLSALESKASETVEVTLDANLLGLAGRYLDGKDPAEADVKAIIGGLQGVYVRSYTFDDVVAVPSGDIAKLKQQLAAPGWSRIVGARSRKENTNVEVFLRLAGDKAIGLAVLAIEPKQFTIVNIVGAVDLERLHRLEGQLGVPKLEIAKPAR
jgi:Domain of unknown function (DUF4252)